MTLVFILDQTLCPVTPMRIEVDDEGVTREVRGRPNAQVCLHSDPAAFFRFYLQRVARNPH